MFLHQRKCVVMCELVPNWPKTHVGCWACLSLFELHVVCVCVCVYVEPLKIWKFSVLCQKREHFWTFRCINWYYRGRVRQCTPTRQRGFSFSIDSIQLNWFFRFSLSLCVFYCSAVYCVWYVRCWLFRYICCCIKLSMRTFRRQINEFVCVCVLSSLQHPKRFIKYIHNIKGYLNQFEAVTIPNNKQTKNETMQKRRERERRKRKRWCDKQPADKRKQQQKMLCK